jgi:beta-glucanase (GH16 family)
VDVKPADKKWHNYGVLWTEDKITWIYDGVEFLTYENPRDESYPQKYWPYDRDFYVIMNVAMGGTLGGDIPKDVKKCLMEVDYVRWYQ